MITPVGWSRPPARPASRRCSRSHGSSGTRGQATVELALGLPIVVLAALLVLQFAIVAAGQLRVVHAAREGARVASTGGTNAEIRRQAADSSGISSSSLELSVRTRGTNISVTASLAVPTDLPLIGPLLPDLTLRGNAVMRRES